MHNEPTVLILTQPFDVTADGVVEELDRRGVPVFRCNPGGFPRDLTLVADLGAGWTGGLRLPDRQLRLDEIGCAQKHDQIVYKPLSSAGVSEDGRYKLVYANRLTEDDITDTVSATGHLFQRWVDKAYEVRLTVVDDVFFAVRIDAESEADTVDWRTDYDNLRYAVVNVPHDVREHVLDLLELLRLRFAALDFVVTPSGEWVFLEANPNGQFAWLQDATGVPIAAAIVDALTKGPPR